MDYRTILIVNSCTQRFYYLEMWRAVWGLPQVGILANKLLRRRLLPHGYSKCTNTPGLWKHEWQPILFTLVVDDFGIKYVGKEHVEHLLSAYKRHTNSPRIGRATYIATSPSNGITTSNGSTFPCRDISKNFSSNTNIACQLNLNIVHTPLPPNSTEQNPSTLTC